MGIWYINLSDYMGGRCLGKLNSMGGWVKIKCLLPPPGIFSGIALTRTTIKSLMGSKFGQIRPWAVELAALDHLEKSP